MKKIKFNRIVFLFLSVSLISSCATIYIPIPIVNASNLNKKMPYKALIVIDEKIKTEEYKSSQLLITWIYPLGKVLPTILNNSFMSVFDTVDTDDNDLNKNSYDIVIRPELNNFTVEVPITIFSQTKTYVTISYHVNDLLKNKKYTLVANGDHNVVTDRDKFLYEQLSKQAPKVFVVFVKVTKYEYLAARDSAIALIHCIDDLNQQLQKKY